MRPTPLLTLFEPDRKFPRRRRTITIGRGTALLVGFALLLLLGWSGATAWYFTSRHEVALKLLEKQANLKRSYEEQISAMRARIEEASVRRESVQEDVGARLSALLARQASLEKRAVVVQTIAERAGVEVISLADPIKTGSAAAAPGPGVSAYAPVARATEPDQFQLRLRPADAKPEPSAPEVHGLVEGLDTAARTLAAMEIRQLRSLESLLRKSDEQAILLQAAIRSAGLNPSKVGGPASGLGGPLVAATGKEGVFENLAVRTEASVQRLERLRRSVAALPFSEPIHGDPDLSSGFGYRIDPFTRSPALHTGLDFRAEQGAPVRATGAGRVVTAEYAGAYGNLVEIEHANGVTTRYGHLSVIGVSAGQTVLSGSILGRVGSTGRSTGPHLHYETRVDGEAVDPQRFLKAAAQLATFEAAMR